MAALLFVHLLPLSPSCIPLEAEITNYYHRARASWEGGERRWRERERDREGRRVGEREGERERVGDKHTVNTTIHDTIRYSSCCVLR